MITFIISGYIVGSEEPDRRISGKFSVYKERPLYYEYGKGLGGTAYGDGIGNFLATHGNNWFKVLRTLEISFAYLYPKEALLKL